MQYQDSINCAKANAKHFGHSYIVWSDSSGHWRATADYKTPAGQSGVLIVCRPDGTATEYPAGSCKGVPMEAPND